jgi:hypothetical protein
MNKQTLLTSIKKILANRRVVYFSKYTDSQKQQLIINAERTMVTLQYSNGPTFVQNVKKFANQYLVPLIPNSNSPMHNTITNTYNQIINL